MNGSTESGPAAFWTRLRRRKVHAFRGEVDLAFEWLGRAYDQRDSGIAEIKINFDVRVPK